MYNHNKAQQSKNRVHISWDILYNPDKSQSNMIWYCTQKVKEWADFALTLQWRHNGHDSVSNHQPHDCFLNRLFRHRSNKTSKLRVTGLCVGNSPEAGEFPAQMASNAENVSMWWRHHEEGNPIFHPYGQSMGVFCIYLELECLFSSLFRLTTEKRHQSSILLSLCEGNLTVLRISLAKDK